MSHPLLPEPVEPFQIRLARSAEVALLTEIELAAATRFATSGLDALVSDTQPVPVELLALAQSEARLWVALADGQVVGFALARMLGADAYLEEIDVRPEWSGHGLGGALIAAVSAWAGQQGAVRLTLITFRDVPWNAPWYWRQGFRELPLATLPAPLLAMWQAEAAHGLDPAQRVVMAR